MTALLGNRTLKLLGLLAALTVIIWLIFSSILFGVIDTSWRTAIDAYTNFNGTNEHIVIKEVRVPRALIATAVGASLGIAGALLQALTRNPLADVEILGLNNGASLFIVVAVSFFSINSLTEFTWIAFIGVALTGLCTYLIGAPGRDGLTPLKLTLAGAAMAALASSLTYGLLTINEQALDEILFWLTGSVAARHLDFLWGVLPYMMVGLLLALMIAGPIHTLMMGEDVAKGLGQRTLLVKIISGIAVILLTGSAVAVAGPIGFVGLIVPHIARFLVGNELRWLFIYSALLGSILLLSADISARFIAYPGEMPIGVMTALIGAPFFLYVARKGITEK